LFLLAHPFLIGLPLSKDVVGRAVGSSYFSEKVSAFAAADVCRSPGPIVVTGD
jgi:hypothetical protein